MGFIVPYKKKMKHKCMMLKNHSMILLIISLSIILFSCSSPKSIESQGPQKEIDQQETLKELEQSESPKAGLNVSGLDFNSTPSDVIKKLGEPSAIQTAPGVSVYYYNDENKEYHGNEISFIGDKLCRFHIVDRKLDLPKDIRVGDNIVKALREYYIPKELSDLGIEGNDTDGEMLQKIINRKNHIIYLNDYENSKTKLRFDLPSGKITSMTISKGKAKSETIRLEPSDFTAGAEEIAEKFGYPDEIIIYSESSFDFEYEDSGSEIKFLGTSSISANSFNFSKSWMAPHDINIGDEIQRVFERFYIPDEIGDLGIDKSMDQETVAKILKDLKKSYINFDLLKDYGMLVIIDESGTIEWIRICKFDYPQYQVTKAADLLEAPLFDKETIATIDDLYFSGCTFGSNRLAVYQLLGNPQKAEAGYDEYTGNYQDCYFESSVVYFLDVTDYEDLETGRAWHYFTRDPDIIGPRGLRVGDNVEKILEVFPGRDDIDFKTITSPAAIYTNLDSPDEVTNSATVNPSDNKTYTGEVNINIDWVNWLSFNYEDGIITSILYGQMLD